MKKFFEFIPIIIVSRERFRKMEAELVLLRNASPLEIKRQRFEKRLEAAVRSVGLEGIS